MQLGYRRFIKEAFWAPALVVRVMQHFNNSLMHAGKQTRQRIAVLIGGRKLCFDSFRLFFLSYHIIKESGSRSLFFICTAFGVSLTWI